jgi:pimeloyl-ACP methyl ester carboxylesterase
VKRRTFVGLAGAAVATTGLRRRAHAQTSGTTFLVAHGAWSAGWVWKKMHPLMRSAGHQLISPTCTGLGERGHLANPSIDLEMHIQDMLGVIKCERLRDFILIGHSYGGMVATGVADHVPERIRKLVYLDAFVPRDGQALMDLVPPTAADRMRAGAKANDGWRVPANPLPPDTSPDDVEWIQSLRMPQPVKTFETPLRLRNGDTKIPRAYIYCKRATPEDTFRQFAQRAQREDWVYREIDASHSPHVTAPESLMALLESIALSA